VFENPEASQNSEPEPLASSRAITKLPARDLDRARAFYRNRLGRTPVEEREGGPMVCAHGRRQRREVARMDMRSYNEQVKRGFAPTRPGGRVPRHWAYTVPTLHLRRIACPSATCPFVVLVRLDPTEEEPCGTC
jgi:hypothetical protein